MTDDEARELLRLLALYFRLFGPEGNSDSPPPHAMRVSELAEDLRYALPKPEEPAFDSRLDRLGLR